MRYRGENLIEKSINEGYREGFRERRFEITLNNVNLSASETRCPMQDERWLNTHAAL
jgi:hypothetical protein